MKTITCPKLVRYALIILFMQLFIGVIGVFFLTEIPFVGVIFCICSLSMTHYIPFFIRTFLPVTINENGVFNRFCNYSWADVKTLHIETLDIKFGRQTLWKIHEHDTMEDLGLMICLQKEENAPRKNFYDTPKLLFRLPKGYPLKDCIFLPYNEQTVLFIKKHAPHLLFSEK